MRTEFDPDDYSVVVKHRAIPPEAMEMGNLLRREETADRAVTCVFPIHGKG
jgi:hypothetical protein